MARVNPETYIVRGILEILNLLDIPAWKHWGGPMSKKGVSDIIGTVPPTGRALFLEVKCPGKRLHPDQEKFLAWMDQAGAITGMVTSVKEAVDLLKSKGYAPAERIWLK